MDTAECVQRPRFWVSILSIAGTIAVNALSATSTAAAEPVFKIAAMPPGITAPDLILEDFDGVIRSVEFQSRPTLVVFWASWCPPCRKELPTLDEFQRSEHGDRIRIQTVSYAEPADVSARFLAEIGVSTLNVLIDPQRSMAKDWRIGALPLAYLVDSQGKMAFQITGEVDWTSEIIQDLVVSLTSD